MVLTASIRALLTIQTNSLRVQTMNRVDEIDFLRAVFITLMVMFHLAYFADMHPFAKQVVYTFHMSGFLLISGYLSSDGSDSTPVAKRLSRIGWVFVPYAIMETGYTVMSAVLPVRERLGELCFIRLVLIGICTRSSCAFLCACVLVAYPECSVSVGWWL